jgi:toxin secretion/phage lysis holin
MSKQYRRGDIVGQKTDTLYTIILGWIFSSIVYLVGGVDRLFVATTILIVLDYITGVVSAWYLKELSSRMSYWGLVRKSMMLVCVIVAHQLDLVAGNEQHFMRNAMMMFIIATEGISIFENMGKIGVKYPPFIMSALVKLRGDTGGRGKKSDK